MARRNGSPLSAEVVVIVCVLGLGGALARVLQESSPATYTPSAKIPLLESPYYLPGITNQSETVPAVPGVSAAKAFRIMGAPEGPQGSSSFALTFENAYKACQDVGLGMAALLDDAHKAAADRLIQHSIYVNPDNSNTTKGCCSGFVWAAGYRVNLSDSKCIGSFPYFTIPPNSTAGFGYQGCGKDPLKDWTWRVTDANNQVTNVTWSSMGHPEKWWYNDANVGDSQGDPQPTGWNGPFNLQPYPNGGSYENCTALKFLMRDGTESSSVKPQAYGVSWYNDFGCEAPLARWICEFSDGQQGVTSQMSNKTVNSQLSPLTKSFFYIPGVTDDYQPSNIGTQVYRVMGITPDKAALLRSSSGPGVNGSVTWKDAQSVCIYNGGTGLASFDTGATQSAARNQLLARLGSKLSSSPLWIGGAFFDIPSPATIGQPSLWKWFTAYSTKNINASATVPATGSHWQWGGIFPSADPQYVNSAYGNNITAGDPTSCMAAVRDGSSDHWENRQCDAKDVTLFICSFPSNMTGFDLPMSEGSSGSSTNVGAIVGGVIGGLALLACCAGLAAFFLLKRRKAAKAAAEEEKKRAAKAAEEERKWEKFPSNRAMGDTFTHAHADTIDPDCWQKAAPNKTFTDTRNSTDFMMTDTHATSTAAHTLRNGTTDDVPGQSTSTNPAAIKARTHAIIDAFANRKVKFHEQYRLLPGPQNRREGGQGVVVFATSKFNSDQWAVKFFASYRHFKEERAMYEDPILAKVLPEIRDIVDTHELPMQSPQGFPVPPFVIMGQGQPFDEWVASISPDFPLALQVLLHLAKKLQQIHQQGFAHRDVKPSNVILDSRTKQWVLIDFASAAPIGSVSSLSYSLHYAPPELAQALEAKQNRMPISGALDVWALGIMAWTLLTGIPPYENYTQIMDKLLGRAKFPWEQPLTREVRQKLGILAPSVLSMLTRDPSQRATVDELLAKWTALFHGTTTETHDDQDMSQLAVQSNADTDTRSAMPTTTHAKSTLTPGASTAGQSTGGAMSTAESESAEPPKLTADAGATQTTTASAPVALQGNAGDAPAAPEVAAMPAATTAAAEAPAAPATAPAAADGAAAAVDVVVVDAEPRPEPVSGFLATPPVAAAHGATDAASPAAESG